MFKNKSNKADKAKKQEPPVFKQQYLNNCHRTYSCIHCRAHLANHDELISKLFQGNHGRAYLFNKVVNIKCKQAVQRELLTGLHAVADIYCDSCETTLGWKYEQAFVPSQKYKEGKYIIELVNMLKENNWDPTSYNSRDLLEEADSAGNKQAHQHFVGSASANNIVGEHREPNNSRVRRITSLSVNYKRSEGDPGADRLEPEAQVRLAAHIPTLPAISRSRFNESHSGNSGYELPQVMDSRMGVDIMVDGIELIEMPMNEPQRDTSEQDKQLDFNQNDDDSSIERESRSVNSLSHKLDSICSSRSQSDMSSSTSDATGGTGSESN